MGRDILEKTIFYNFFKCGRIFKKNNFYGDNKLPNFKLFAWGILEKNAFITSAYLGIKRRIKKGI